MNIETANRLLQYRKKNNLSQEELAAKIGVSRQAVSKWERAEASPDTDNLILLAEIYGVTLDELLKGEKSNDNANEVQDSAAKVDENEADTADENINYVKSDKISFKNGIHIDSKDGDHVHINLKDGVHVHDKNGDKVDVGWSGIHVEESGKKRVYTDCDGNVMVDENISCHICEHKRSKWNKFPFFILPIIAFFVWGFSGVCFGFGLSWICFLTIPLYYSLVDACFKHNPNHFAYPVLVVIAYLLFGYFNVCGGWAMGWVVFLSIPVYYWVCSLFKDEIDEED